MKKAINSSDLSTFITNRLMTGPDDDLGTILVIADRMPNGTVRNYGVLTYLAIKHRIAEFLEEQGIKVRGG